jgi:dienelactone hydrolase
MIRSFLDAIRIESAAAPFDTIQCRVFYPAQFGDTEGERATGVIPADADAPMPVVIFMQGVNIPAFTVHWLMTELASHGFVVVLPEWMAQNLPGRTSFSPGIDLSALKSESLGTRPSSLLLPSVVCQLQKWNEHGVLKNKIDASRMIFGGHSAGGSMALLNAKRDWFPNVVGAFSYCTNLLATFALGDHPKGKLLPLPSDTPTLMIGATEDGIAAHHNAEFGNANESGEQIIARTFDECVTRARGDSHLLIVEGANHHSICNPIDDTLGRTFLDSPETAEPSSIRRILSECVALFIRQASQNETNHFSNALKSLKVDHTLVKMLRSK